MLAQVRKECQVLASAEAASPWQRHHRRHALGQPPQALREVHRAVALAALLEECQAARELQKEDLERHTSEEEMKPCTDKSVAKRKAP